MEILVGLLIALGILAFITLIVQIYVLFKDLEELDDK